MYNNPLDVILWDIALANPRERHHPRGWDVMSEDGMSDARVREVADRVAPRVEGFATRASLEDVVRECIRDYRQAVLDETFLYRHKEGRTFVQHSRTGIRGEFLLHGGVFAKPYHFDISVESHRPLHPDGEIFHSRGVGTRMYRVAAYLHPDVRWKKGMTTEASDGVRRHLHEEDPWRWASECAPCKEFWRNDQHYDPSVHHPGTRKNARVMLPEGTRLIQV